ncbi:hypothetical protein [Polyangium fumosum]|uniref:DUF697 domain-containing protein n=1 Tax=Polyangium fumosum TaxID=889272 RepID=A0A4U1J0Q7_9BACT|nr:hypothetical protein [Polyangium fumosum]TKD00574.1 hypothetical protein E8A74_34335 [Polyangium fumosum]
MASKQQAADQQSLFTDDLFYFILRLRKSRIRSVAERVRRMYPDESPERQARRLIASTSAISFAAGGLVHAPAAVPGFGIVYEGLGFVAGASILTRMHLYLVLEIALLFGKDIDQSERVKELVAVLAACAAGAAAPVAVALTLNPAFAVPAGALAATAVTQAIGESAIRRYKRATAPEAAPVPAPARG